MKCKNCNNNVKITMNCCPFCGYDLNEQILYFLKKEKFKKNIVFVSTIIILIIIFIASKFIGKKENVQQLNDMVTSICKGEYETIYTSNKFDNQGVYQCKKNDYVYYVDGSGNGRDFYNGKIYEIGYTYNKQIEKIFPDSIYFYRESRVTTIPSELKIAVVSNSEEELINNYAEKFYKLVKELNKEYDEDIQFIIFYNNTLSGINTTYDKLFLMSYFNTYNVTHPYGMGISYGKYSFSVGDPYDLLNTIFSNKNSYPSNARKAIKYNRNIVLKITDGQTIGYEEFVEKFRNSFNDSF